MSLHVINPRPEVPHIPVGHLDLPIVNPIPVLYRKITTFKKLPTTAPMIAIKTTIKTCIE